METFYHDVKEHMSPSALSQWFHQRSSFIKSYFEGEKGPETSAMAAGTRIHRLIEAGLIPAKHVFEHGEEEIRVQVPGSGFWFMGKPDSREAEAKDGTVRFVDYKSGKANGWKEKLPTDLKMKATAWLVWMVTGQPDKVVGSIEFIATTWDPEAREVVPIEGVESEIIEHTYTGAELETFTSVIIKTMGEVNDFYQRWKESSADFVSDADVTRLAELDAEKTRIEEEMDEIKDRLKDQMEFGGVLNHKTDLGTVYLTERRTYTYPAELSFEVDGEELTLDRAEKVAAAASAAKKNYELVTDPVSTSVSVGFRKPGKGKRHE